MIRRSRKLAQQGFTLIELVAVLVIVAILALLAAPRFFAVSTFSERGFFDDALGAVRYAQKLAVASGCNVQVSLTATGYSLMQPSGCTSGAYTQPVPNPGTGEASYTGQAPSGVTLSSTLSPIVFDPLGQAENGAGNVSGATITVTGGQTRQINVVGETGFVYSS
ncbi:MAG: GspH/FimT family pseudopilin [Gammaproteobacteria bacterium]|nr:GspH/FimT family pseudopilin [Gammaproteobacteria bacterium]